MGRQQELLEAHDTVVLQFPFFWYSTPPILKQWQDLVLEHGWAYGSKGTALSGKTLAFALSAGGPDEAYGPAGYNGHTVRQLLAPLEQTGRLCGMHVLPPWIVYGTHRLSQGDIPAQAGRYGTFLRGLVHDRLDPGDPALSALPDLNALVDDWATGEAA